MTRPVYLNVGGVCFATSVETLRSKKGFFRTLSQRASSDDAVFVDRDPTHFRHVLNFLRGVRHLPDDVSALKELAWEADFYGLEELYSSIVERLEAPRPATVPEELRLLRQEIRQA